MKTKLVRLFILVVSILYIVSCEGRDWQPFYVENNSDQDIVLSWGGFPADGPGEGVCFAGVNRREFLDDCVSKSHAIKNFEHIGNSITRKPSDTIYICLKI